MHQNSLDRLRVFTTFAVFLFHCAHVFDGLYFHVSNKESSFFFLFLVLFLNLWIMPLFFAISGGTSLYSLGKRKFTVFIRERFFRLVIPYCMGIVLLIPPQKYVEALDKGRFQGNLLEFIPFMFSHRSHNYFTPDVFGSYGHHLWFLAFLFVFSLLVYPLSSLSRPSRDETGFTVAYQGFIRHFAGIRGVALIAFPLMALSLAIRPLAPGYGDWPDFVYWFSFFIAGYLIHSSEVMLATLERRWYLFLIAGLSSFSVMFALMGVWGVDCFFNPTYSLHSMVGYSCWYLTAFFLTLAGLGVSRRYFNSLSPVYLCRLTMPFYAIHQTVVLLVAFMVVRLDLFIGAKFILLAIIALIGTAILTVVVARFRPTRFLFGMK